MQYLVMKADSQIMLVNKIYYSYPHVKSGVVCPRGKKGGHLVAQSSNLKYEGIIP